MRTYKICSPYAPETGGKDVSDRLSSDQAAVDERIDNIRVIPRAELAARLGLPSVAVMRAAVEKLKLWDNGSTLRVQIPRRRPEVQEKVAAIAKEWEAGGQPDARLRQRPARPRSGSASPRRGSRGRPSAPTP